MTTWNNKWFGFWRDGHGKDDHLPLLKLWIEPNWQPSDRADLVRYIEQSPVVVAASNVQSPCPICGRLLSSSSFQSDGVWLWPQDLIHYLAEHWIRIPDEFADRIRANGYTPPESVAVEIDQLPWP